MTDFSNVDLEALAKLCDTLREHGVASYNYDGQRITLNFFPPVPPQPDPKEIDEAEAKRKESQDAWERKMKYGAAPLIGKK